MLELLNVPIEGLTSNERYCLVRLINGHIKVGRITEDNVTLARQYNVKEHTVKSVLNDFLVKNGYAKKTRADLNVLPGRKRPGRPRTAYELIPNELNKLLETKLLTPSEKTTNKHTKLIKKLLFKNILSQLTVSQTLLLAVMLYHANECGAVRGLSYTGLKRLTGMKLGKLKQNIKELLDQKIIISITSGGAGVFGKISSVYYLSLPDNKEPDQLKKYYISAPHAHVALHTKILFQRYQTQKLRYAAELKKQDATLQINSAKVSLEKATNDIKYTLRCPTDIENIAYLFVADKNAKFNLHILQSLVEQFTESTIPLLWSEYKNDPESARNKLNRYIEQNMPPHKHSEQLAFLISSLCNTLTQVILGSAILDTQSRSRFFNCETVSCIAIAGFSLENNYEREIIVKL